MNYPQIPGPEITIPELGAKQEVTDLDLLFLTDQFGRSWKVPVGLLVASQGIARKIDNWQVDTFADAQDLSATLPGSAFIEVIADETQGGVRALYFWNTIELQEPLLL